MLFSRDPAVLAFAQRYTYLVLPFTWAYAVFNGIMCFINGIGEIRYPTIVNILLLWVVRILPLISSCMPAMANMPWSVFPPALLPA